MEEKKLTAHRRYELENTKRVSFKFNLNTDRDVLDWLEQQPSKQGAVKALIREKIKKDQEASRE